MGREVLSWFWSPLCAVGAVGPHGPNAQICLSVFGASIVPERPRLLVVLSHTNYTMQLAAASGRLGVTLLGEGQVGLLEPLGLHSGRHGNKLAGLSFETDANGAPLFTDGSAGTVSCEVLEAFDCGDSTAFLCAVRERQSFEREPLSWAAAREVVGAEFLARWQEKSLREQAAARAAMTWRDG